VITIDDAIDAGFRYLTTRQADKAEQVSKLLLGISPRNPDALFILGRALQARGSDGDAQAIFEHFLWAGPVARWTIIQAAILFLKAHSYLEIGVAEGFNLTRIGAPTKISVDPAALAPRVAFDVRHGATAHFQMTSDEFFATVPQDVLAKGIDVAFVDGLHTYSQSLADAENCLRHLNHGGVVFMHDCNPPSAEVGTPAPSLAEALRLTQPRGIPAWTGDVWKTIVHLRACRNDLRVCVLDCDFGVGMIVQGPPDERLPLSPKEVEALTYADLDKNRQRFLNLQPPHELFQILDSMRAA
jgi:hypothetical protein